VKTQKEYSADIDLLKDLPWYSDQDNKKYQQFGLETV
jgi:hypothetical protein